MKNKNQDNRKTQSINLSKKSKNIESTIYGPNGIAEFGWIDALSPNERIKDLLPPYQGKIHLN